MSFYLTPVEGELLIGREDEVKRMLSVLFEKDSRAGFAITGIRRIGKTSILKEVKRRLEEKNIVAIYISAWDAFPATLDAFVSELFDRTILAFKDKFSLQMKIGDMIRLGQEGLANLLTHLNISASIEDKITYTVSYARGENVSRSRAISSVFEMADDLAVKTGTQCVLMIDEFPSLTDLKTGRQAVGDAILKLIRTINENYKRTSLVVSGSFAYTMQQAVGSQSSPLYKQLLSLHIEPLKEDAVREFVAKYLSAKKISKAGLRSLMAATGGIPYNLQLLGRYLKDSETDTIGKDAVAAAVSRMLKAEGRVHFASYLNMLKTSEVRIVKAMAKSGAKSPREIADAENREINEVTGLLCTLLSKDVVYKRRRGIYEITDGMFCAWLRYASSAP